ncbi:MAG: 16S rRNA (guanine(527)-N(7))-methyltransferase RsmG [Oligoflexia bacterium]|nr:16S rRNA (guanine(527)-N(7))-methyltransferase RsmG [Oligoflexia bacterium]
MEKLLREAGISLTQNQLESLWKFHKLIRKYNTECDLTRLYNFESMVIKHYIDCLITDRFVKPGPPLIDIGTGAGFPGIPLKILNPEMTVTLAEPKPQRVKFLHIAISELGLKNINIYPHKITSNNNLEGYNSVITRAFETIDKTLKRVEKLLNKNGKIYFMKGPNSSEEIREAQKASPQYSLINDFSYSISSRDKRRLLVFTR